MNEVLTHNYILGPVDTDSISFCKPDYAAFSKEEQENLLNEINSLLPECVQYDHDGYFRKVIICAAKNYVLDDGKTVKIKGSALKASTKPPALKEMIRRIIQSILDDRNDFNEIYHEYIKEAMNVKDIKRWASRKTISEKTLTSERTNETRIKDTLDGTEYVEGDRIYTFFKDPKTLELVERFDGKYDLDALLKSCYDTICIFENVLDMTQFKNYKLKKHKALLEELNDQGTIRRDYREDQTNFPRELV